MNPPFSRKRAPPEQINIDLTKRTCVQSAFTEKNVQKVEKATHRTHLWRISKEPFDPSPEWAMSVATWVEPGMLTVEEGMLYTEAEEARSCDKMEYECAN
jgi:hypothetical protein